MSEVRLVPRLLVLLVAALLIAGCAARMTPEANPGSTALRANPCASGTPPMKKQAPIVCIDDSARKLVVSPDPVHVHDVNESDRITPVPMQWFTKSGTGDIQVRIDPGCVDKKACNGNGKCSAETVRSAAGKTCKYDVWITGGKHDKLDPTVVVDPCCG
jgi:hypothetical protein